MPYLDVFSVPHFYTLTPEVVNSDSAVVFIHGWLLSQRYWQPVIDNLKEDFQCLSYDLRGFGASNAKLDQRSRHATTNQNSTHPFSLAAYARDLGDLIKTLQLKSVWLVGHSLGGSIALWTAKLFPQHVAGVVCVNAGGGVYLEDEFSRFRQAGQQIVRWRPRWLQSVPFISHAFTRLMVFKPLDAKWGKERLADLLAADRDAAVGVLLESTTQDEVHQLPNVVAHLKQPVYFVAGAQDMVMEEKYVRHLASFHTSFGRSSGNVEVLPECGHMAMVEQPEGLARVIRTLIESASSSESTPSESSSTVR